MIVKPVLEICSRSVLSESHSDIVLVLFTTSKTILSISNMFSAALTTCIKEVLAQCFREFSQSTSSKISKRRCSKWFDGYPQQISGCPE